MKIVINQLLKELVIELVNLEFPERDMRLPGRPRTCSNEQCVEAVFEILKTGIGWEYLKSYPIKGDSIRKRIEDWNNVDIFKKAWLIMVNIHIDYGMPLDDLFIDATHIKNYNGQNVIGRNFYDRFKTSTKMTTIVDNNGIPIGITLGCGNKHDLTFVEEALDSIDIGSFNYMDCQNLIADKGYWSNDVQRNVENKYKLKLITPSMRSREEGKEEKQRIKELNSIKHKLRVEDKKLNEIINELQTIKDYPIDERKDNRIKMNDKLKEYKLKIKQLKATKRLKERIKKKRGRKSNKDKKLGKRYVVERTMSWFKRYDRLLIRKDKNFSSFEGFVFLGAANIVARSLTTHI